MTTFSERAVPSPRNDRTWPHQALWMLGAVALVLVVAITLRLGTNILEKDTVFDEAFTRIPIDDLIVRGWSVETAIDYTETKGPAFVWTYAALGETLGGTLNTLRLVTVAFFALGVVPLLLIARRCGLDGPSQVFAAACYCLLPHLPVLGQLLMSEPSFVFGALWLCWAFLWGFGRSADERRPVAGPVLVAMILSLLLHHRVHAAAFAAAIVLVAVERDRVRAWPWILAVAAAAVSRLPLFLRWGGVVAPDYQSAHALGLGLSSVAYLVAALAPMLAILLWPATWDVRYRCRRRLVWAGAVAGFGLAVIATPDLRERVSIVGLEPLRFLGLVAHGVRDVVPAAAQGAAIVALTSLGAASLAALAVLAWDRPPREPIAVVHRLQLWTFVAGCGMYTLTRSVVYDRYLLPWAVLMPIVWVFSLPRRGLIAQMLLLAAIQAWYVYRLLIRV